MEIPSTSEAVQEALERTQWATFWLPDDVTVHDRDEIAYRVCPRDNPTMNAVIKLRAAPPRQAELVREVAAAHGRVRSRWHVPDTAHYEGLSAHLERHDYVPGDVHDVRAVAVVDYLPRPDSGVRVAQVGRMHELLEANDVIDRAFAVQTSRTQSSLKKDLAGCTGPDARTARFVAYEGERPVSHGAITAYDDLGIGLLWGGSTLPDERHQGHYSALVAARIEYARRRGLSMVGLYAVTDTSSPVVSAQGFRKFGEMHYWERSSRGVPRRD